MLTYIILTYILCILGGGLYYLLLRERVSSSNQKTALLSVLGLSLLIPLFFVQSTAFVPKPAIEKHIETVKKDVYILEESVFLDFCPTGEVLEACYQQAITSEDFCNCEDIEKENLLYYQESSIYNFLTWQETAFWKILGFAAVLTLLFLLGNLVFLLWLIAKSQKEERTIEGTQVIILHTHRPFSVASFRLIKRYIIWQEEMEHLSEKEQNAIIWHELAHIHQFDTWVKILVNLLQVLWFANPLYYLLRNDLDRLNEYIADEFAVQKWGNARSYAQLLFKMKTGKQVAVAQHFKRGSLLKERIKHILESNSKRNYRILNFINIVLIGLCFSLTSQYAHPIVDQQIDKLKVYQTLSKHNTETGKTTFCKVCMQKELEEACQE